MKSKRSPYVGEVYRDLHPRISRLVVVCQKLHDFGMVRICSLNNGRKTWIKKFRLLDPVRFRRVSRTR